MTNKITIISAGVLIIAPNEMKVCCSSPQSPGLPDTNNARKALVLMIINEALPAGALQSDSQYSALVGGKINYNFHYLVIIPVFTIFQQRILQKSSLFTRKP